MAESHAAEMKKIKDSTSAQLSESAAKMKEMETEWEMKFNSLVKDSTSQIEELEEKLSNATEEIEQLQQMSEVQGEAVNQLKAKDKALEQLKEDLRKAEKSSHINDLACIGLEDEIKKLTKTLKQTSTDLQKKTRQAKSDADHLKEAEQQIEALEEQARQLQDESLPEECAELFELATAAKAGRKYGAALRLLNEGAEEAYYLTEDLEEEEDERRLKQVTRALDHYTDHIMGQVRTAFDRAPYDVWKSILVSDDPEWDCPLSDEVTLQLAKAAAKEVAGAI
jgi:DNA repair exonuclease SbcCD ATPase subunit